MSIKTQQEEEEDARRAVNSKAMQLYQEMFAKNQLAIPEKQARSTFRDSQAEEDDDGHNNAQFFQGYQDRFQMIKDMASQVRDEIEEQDEKPPTSKSSFRKTEQASLKNDSRALVVRPDYSNQLVPFVDMEQMKRKAKDAHQVLSWKEKVQRDLEKRVMEDKARAKFENAVAVKQKTTDVKKDL